MRKCGDCGHWGQAKPYMWGRCYAPMPSSADAFLINSVLDLMLFPGDEMAEECPCYKESPNA